MELRMPTPAQLETVYAVDLKPSFPPSELKPLRAIREMWEEGSYAPWCLFDGDDIAGECFLWRGRPGFVLLDYLCVSVHRRNGGLGALLLQKMREQETDAVILAETEAPVHAPDPDMARRRLDFYLRNGAKIAAYDTEIFGAHYQTLYWSERPVEEQRILGEHRFIYENRFSPAQYARHIHIPRDTDAGPPVQVAWEE